MQSEAPSGATFPRSDEPPDQEGLGIDAGGLHRFVPIVGRRGARAEPGLLGLYYEDSRSLPSEHLSCRASIYAEETERMRCPLLNVPHQ